MRTAIFVTIFAILVALASSYPADNPEGVEKSPSEKISGGVVGDCIQFECSQFCWEHNFPYGYCFLNKCNCY